MGRADGADHWGRDCGNMAGKSDPLTDHRSPKGDATDISDYGCIGLGTRGTGEGCTLAITSPCPTEMF